MGPSVIDNNLIEAMTEYQKPIHHTPINLGIKKLKRELQTLYPDMLKSKVNMIVKAYKKRAWSEYAAVARFRGTFPTHPSYRTNSVDVDSDEETTQIKVKNGKQK